MANEDERYDPNATTPERQKKAAELVERQLEEDRRREQALNVSTMLTTKAHIGKILAEPDKEQEMEDLKVGTFERIGRLEKVETAPLETEDVGETDVVVTRPFPIGGQVGGAQAKTIGQRVQEVLDEHKPKEEKEAQGASGSGEASKEDEEKAESRQHAAHKAKKK